MEQIPLAVTRREYKGKGAARKLRAQGLVPAVIYGTAPQAENLAVATKDLQKVLRQVTGSTAFLALEVDGGKSRTAVLQELQTDHMGREMLHVDFYEVRPDQDLTLEIPLSFQGESPGAALGGVVSFAVHSIMVKGKVADIPDNVVADISGLEIGDTLHADELELPAGVELTSVENFLVASCQEPAKVEEVVEEEELAEGEAEEEEGAEKPSEASTEGGE